MNNKIFSKVFMWMFIGLAITFITALYVSTQPNMVNNIFSGGTYIFLIIAQIATVIFLSARIKKMSAQTAKITFIVYSILTGLTFSSIFVAFNIQTIVYAFGITSFIFMIFSIIGYTTNIDLTKMGTYLFVALIVLILGSIFSIFIDSSALDFYMVIFGILLFIGFVAYDIQKIKKMMYHIEDEEKVAIYGALHLYLDFINLFIRILSLLARNKN